MSKIVNAGIVTAYGAAVRGGYEGTYTQFCADLAQLSQVLEEFLGFSVTVETLAAGASATANYDDGVLALGIPRGDTGNGIQSIVLNADYTLTVTYTNGNTWTSGSIRGQVGATPHLTIGTVQTLEPWQSATASITGTDTDPILNLGIPKGQAGASDAGGVSYDPEGSYDEGTVGAELQEQNRQLSDLEDTVSTTQIINSASGAIASFADGADSMPIKKLVAQIEPVQDLHGQDSPYPPGGGKNLLEVESVVDLTSLGVTQTLNLDGTVTVSGTANTAVNLAAIITVNSSNRIYLPVGRYKFVDTGVNGGSSYYYYLRNSENSIWVRSGDVFEITDTESYCRIIFYAQEGVTVSGTHGLMILKESETDLSWHPYSNICPISGWTGAEIEQTGKNLADKSKFSIDQPDWFSGNWLGLTENADGTYTLTRPIGWGGYGSVYLGTFNPGTYTVSFDAISTANVRCTGALAVKKTGTWIDNVGVTSINVEATSRNSFAAFTTTEKCDFWLSVGPFTDNGAQVISGNYQVEIGTVSHEFSEYTGDQISVAFPETIYGGEDEVISGKLKSTMGMVDLGTLIWNKVEQGSQIFFYAGLPDGTREDNGECVCSVYPTANNAIEFQDNDKICRQYGSAAYDFSRIAVKDSTYNDSTAADFKTAMNGAQLCYELAEPIEYTTEPQTLDTLYGTNNIWASTGDTEVEYPCDTKLYIDGKITQAIANALNS